MKQQSSRRKHNGHVGALLGANIAIDNGGRRLDKDGGAVRRVVRWRNAGGRNGPDARDHLRDSNLVIDGLVQRVRRSPYWHSFGKPVVGSDDNSDLTQLITPLGAKSATCGVRNSSTRTAFGNWAFLFRERLESEDRFLL